MEEETSPSCFVSESLCIPLHSESASDGCSPHGESSRTHVEESRQMPEFDDDGKGKAPCRALVSGSDGIGEEEGLTRNYGVSFVSEPVVVKAEDPNAASEVSGKESSLFSDSVHKEEEVKETAQSEVGVAEMQEFEKSEVGLTVSDEKIPAIESNSEEGLAVPSSSLHEKQESLEAMKKRLLKEIEGKINAKENVSPSTGGEKMKDHHEVIKSVNNGAEDVNRLKGFDGSATNCSFEVEVIDETALIEPVFFPRTGYGGGKESGFSIPGKQAKRQGKNNLANGIDEKKVKRPRRKAKTAKMVPEMAEAHNGRSKNGEGTEKKYNREELESLRFVNIVEQRKMWKSIYASLGPAVSKEYDDLASYRHQNELASSMNQKHMVLNFEPGKRCVRKERLPSILGEECAGNADIELGNLIENEAEDLNPSDAACCYNAVDEVGYMAQGDSSEDYDSDEDYASIQRPAFLVEGEPNFESGPPEDGLEYLRRVRWEAAQVPKVTIAKFDRSKFSKEQTVSLPTIPEIANCPEHLLPLKQWEDVFLSEFSELRLAISHLESLTGESRSQSNMLPGGIKIKTKEVEPYQNPENDATQSFNSKSSTNESSSNYPLLSVIFGMDSVARISMLKKRIKCLKDASTLTRNDCLWLFALCAVVDTPLDADSCASIRSLLRKCCSLRAGKSEFDDEVIMLSILVTIARRYFGQAEAGSS